MANKKKKPVSQMELVKEFFLANPNRDIRVSEVVDWVRPKYQKINGTYARHPDKQVRDLGALQFLIKVRKGINYLAAELTRYVVMLEYRTRSTGLGDVLCRVFPDS